MSKRISSKDKKNAFRAVVFVLTLTVLVGGISALVGWHKRGSSIVPVVSAVSGPKEEGIYPKPYVIASIFVKQPAGFAQANLTSRSGEMEFRGVRGEYVGTVTTSGSGDNIPIRFVLRHNSANFGSTVAANEDKAGKTNIILTFATQKALKDWREKLISAGFGPNLYPHPVPKGATAEDAKLRVSEY